MKKILTLILLAAFAVLGFAPVSFAQAEPFSDNGYDVVSYMLVDAKTGTVLAEKNPNERIYPSSTTKLMTALLVLEQKGLSGETTVGSEVNFSSGSSLMHITPGETVSIKDLFYGMMIASGNDGAAALAVYTAGDIDSFVEIMNQKAQELGMTNTHFVNPHGLFLNANPDIPEKDWGINHYTTAADMMKLALETIKLPEVMDAAQTETYQLSPTNKHDYDGVKENGLPLGLLEQTNRLIYTSVAAEPKGYSEFLYDDATGMKTGLVANIQPADEWISSYGCLVASAERGGMELVAVMFGDQSEESKDRWRLAKDLFEYGFNNYADIDLASYIQPVTLEEQVSDYSQNDPQQGMLTLTTSMIAEPPGVETLDKSLADGLADGSIRVETSVDMTKELKAPIASGEEMGIVRYTLNGTEIYQAPLIANRQVYEQGEEKMAQETYNLEGSGLPDNLWMYIVFPAGGAVGALFIIKALRERAYNAQTRYGGSHRYGGGRHDAYYRHQRSSSRQYNTRDFKDVRSRSRRRL